MDNQPNQDLTIVTLEQGFFFLISISWEKKKKKKNVKNNPKKKNLSYIVKPTLSKKIQIISSL